MNSQQRLGDPACRDRICSRRASAWAYQDPHWPVPSEDQKVPDIDSYEIIDRKVAVLEMLEDY
jgi:hypothetical protein